MKRLLMGVAAVAAAVALAAPAALAAQTVGLAACLYTSGHRTVAAGEPVQLRIGWLDRSPGFVRQFVDAVDVTFSLDGVDVANPESRFGPIEQAETFTPWGNIRNAWLAWWRYELPPLSAGQTVVVGYGWWLTRPVPATTEDGRIVRIEGDVIAAPHSTCAITAA